MMVTKDINKNTMAGTKASLTYTKNNFKHIANLKIEEKIKKYKDDLHDASKDLLDSNSTMKLEEGVMRPLVDPYNPKIHKTSVVDLKHRVASQKILKKGDVDNSNLEKHVWHPRVYLLNNGQGTTIAKKVQGRPWNKIITPYGE